MALKVFNTMSRELEDFTPIDGSNVGLYTCGPTVYNYPHIGNYRAYVFTDILKRYLTYRGYKVNHVMNITDVDDKIIRDSIAQSKSLKEFTEFYTEGFFKDRDDLNLIPAGTYTKATDYIPEMLELTEKLLENKHAYIGDDGSAYFSITTDKEYGKLSHFTLADLKENADNRITKDEYDKENATDFALWKSWDENDGEIYWQPEEILGRPTELKKGRPGWHIECSAMSMKELGESFDIHTGGVDLIFPHHENEIAQSEGATKSKFVKYWMHNEHLMVDGKKMSKSLGNFYTLRDLMDKGIDPIAFRMWLYTANYRTKTNFTIEAVTASAKALNRMREFYTSLGDHNGNVNEAYKAKFIEYMDDDLNTPKALALAWDLVSDASITNADKKATLLDFDQVFGFGLNVKKEIIIPQDVQTLLDERENARNNKDWSGSDKLRDKIKELGYEVKDTDNGPSITKV